MFSVSGSKALRFLHHNQIFDVITEKSDNNIKFNRDAESPGALGPVKLDMWTGCVREAPSCRLPYFDARKASV